GPGTGSGGRRVEPGRPGPLDRVAHVDVRRAVAARVVDELRPAHPDVHDPGRGGGRGGRREKDDEPDAEERSPNGVPLAGGPSRTHERLRKMKLPASPAFVRMLRPSAGGPRGPLALSNFGTGHWNWRPSALARKTAIWPRVTGLSGQ